MGKLTAEIPNSMPPFAFNPAGDIIAVDTREGILLWNLKALKGLRLLDDAKGVFNHSGFWMRDRRALAFSPDGRSFVAARNTLKHDNVFVLDVWAVETGERISSLPANPNTIAEFAFAPSAPLLASAGWDHSVKIFSSSNQGKFGPTVVIRDHHFASFKESPAGTFSPVLPPLPKVLILLPFH